MKELPLFEMAWDEEDVKSISEIIRSGRNWAIGKEVKKFEALLSEYSKMKYALTFNSGTSALHAILLAYGIKNNDEVIVPSFTFISTANSVLFVGGKPVFAEIEPITMGLDPSDVNEKITSKTKAILPVHYGGCPCKIDELQKIAQDNNLLLIEDAAEAFGSKIKNQAIGTFGDSTVLSFCQNKIITTGEGGAIVTNSEEIYKKLKLIRSHGRSEIRDYFESAHGFDYVQLGYNFRMSNILAALGVSQMKKIDKLIKIRREKAQYYTEKLQKIPEIVAFVPPQDYFSVYQLFSVLIASNARNDLIEYLAKNKIPSKIYFDPVHLTQFYREKFGYKREDFPLTEKISSQILSLPFYPTMKNEDIDYVIEAIKEFQ